MRQILKAAMVATALAAVSTAGAAPMLISAYRSVAIGDSGSFILSDDTGGGLFVDTVSDTFGGETVTAGQTTNIDAAGGHFSGTGSALVGFSVLKEQGISANSFFDVFFEISVPHTYSLTGLLTANADGGRAAGELMLVGAALDFLASSPGTTPAVINASGTLAPGSYRLLVSAGMDNDRDFTPGSFMGGTADFFFDLRLTAAAPEPATLALLALALLAISATSAQARRREGAARA